MYTITGAKNIQTAWSTVLKGDKCDVYISTVHLILYLENVFRARDLFNFKTFHWDVIVKDQHKVINKCKVEGN